MDIASWRNAVILSPKLVEWAKSPAKTKKAFPRPLRDRARVKVKVRVTFAQPVSHRVFAQTPQHPTHNQNSPKARLFCAKLHPNPSLR